MKPLYRLMSIMVFLGFSLLYYLGCSNGSLGEPKDVTCDIAFRIPNTGSNIPSERPVVSGDVIYIQEPGVNPNGLIAYDLLNQRELWRGCPYTGNTAWEKDWMFTEEQCILGNSLWIPSYYDGANYLLEVNAVDGKYQKAVDIGRMEDGYHICGFNSCGDGTRVFFFSDNALCYCDTADLTLVDATAKVYKGKVVQVYRYGVGDCVGLRMEKVDGDLLLSYRNADEYSDCGLVRIDLETMQKVWEIRGEVSFDQFTVYMGKVLTPSISYTTPGSELLRFVSYSWETGAFIASYETDFLTYTPPLCVDGVIIQTSNLNNNRFDRPMIYCLDAVTLTPRWKHEVDPDRSWSGSNCQANNGIVYFPRSGGIWLYDLETGKVLGKDESIMASDDFNSAMSIRYGDLLVIQNGRELLGIKMNFKKGLFGIEKE